ncbi:HET-domain-containing protein [Hypoxylon sp. FL1284]|nr:HET-domain-containing protein [Hypoxylon sp. FL1284]
MAGELPAADRPKDPKLCTVCSNIDIASYFKGEKHSRRDTRLLLGATSDALKLGYLRDILVKARYCSFCWIIVEAICTTWSTSIYPMIPEDLIERENNSREPKECWVYSYCSAKEESEDGGPPSQAFRIGVAYRTTGDRLNHAMDHVGDIQLLGEDSTKIRGTLAFSGRRIGPRVSLDLVQEWLRLCEGIHGHRYLLVIDVDRECVTLLPEDTIKALKSNIDALSQPGALKQRRGELPQAIADAIDMALKLGERYLWVDALCIIQDDEEHQRKLINKMDKVYSFAHVTIVPAVNTMDGETACAGFPRYNSRINTRDQAVAVAQGLHMAVPFEPAIGPVSMDTNRWKTRAWTYQECLLSNRILFFTCHQVYFQCRCCVFCEDCWGESTSLRTYISPHTNLANPGAPHNPNEQVINQSLHLQTHSYDWDADAVADYKIMVAEYKSRQLSFKADTLRAFNGIENILQRSMGTRFWYGMPEKFWDIALLFVVTDESHCQRPEDLRNPPFPSWSWAGWNYVSIFGYYTQAGCNIQKEVEWFLLSSVDSAMALKSQDIVVGRAVSFPAEGNKDLGILGSRPSTVLPRLEAEDSFHRHLASPGISVRLGCWTMLAELRVPRKATSLDEATTAYKDLQHLAICDDRDRWIGSIMVANSWVQEHADPSQKFLFMVMSRSQDMVHVHGSTERLAYFDCEIFTDRPWCFLNRGGLGWGLFRKMDGWKRNRLR